MIGTPSSFGSTWTAIISRYDWTNQRLANSALGRLWFVKPSGRWWSRTTRDRSHLIYSQARYPYGIISQIFLFITRRSFPWRKIQLGVEHRGFIHLQYILNYFYNCWNSSNIDSDVIWTFINEFRVRCPTIERYPNWRLLSRRLGCHPKRSCFVSPFNRDSPPHANFTVLYW